MNKCILLAAVAGLGMIAAAGPVEDFSLSLVGPVSVDGGTSITIEVYGDSSYGTHFFGGGFNLATSGDTDAIADIRWSPAEWSTANTPGEYDGNGNYNGLVFGQIVAFTDLIDFPPADGSELGNQIGSFQVDFHVGEVCSIDFDLTALPNPNHYMLSTLYFDVANRTVPFLNSNEGNLALNGMTINALSPSPSGVALLGFGGFAATRRRR